MSTITATGSWADIDVQSDLEKLQGMWVSVEGRRPAEFVITASRFAFRFLDGDSYEGTFDICIDERPRTMVMWIEDGPPRHRGKTAMCIYEFESEQLRWCPAEPGLDDPPEDFPCVEDARFACTVFRRDRLPPKTSDEQTLV